MSIQHLTWGDILSDIQEEVGATDFSLWLSKIQLISLEDDVAVLAAPSSFLCSLIEKKFSPLLIKHLANQFGENFSLRFTVDATLSADVLPQKKQKEKTSSNGRRLRRNPIFTFDTFVSGKNSQLAYEASRHTALFNDDLYNPLVIHGPSGIGKTHLLHSIANQLAEKGKRKIFHLSAENFVNQFHASLRNKTINEFRESFRNARYLLLDDIQTLQNKKAAQQELLYTFNEIQKQNGRIIMTCIDHPQTIRGLNTKLLNRLKSGLVASIVEPDLDARTKILRKKAKHLRLRLSPEILTTLAMRFNANVRELEGVLLRIEAYGQVHGKTIQPADLETLIQEFYAPRVRARPKIAEILKSVCAEFKIDREDILSSKRKRTITAARQVAMYLGRRLVGLSYKEIGEYFGKRSHSTAIVAERKVREKMADDISFKFAVHELIDIIQHTK